MESYVYLAVALLLASSINGRAIDDMDNSIQSANNNDDKMFADRDWVEISLAPPPKLIQQTGTSIELECEVTGSPQPSIHWIRGNNPHNIVRKKFLHNSNRNTQILLHSRLTMLIQIRLPKQVQMP